MASKAFAHRPGAFAPTARTQQAQQSAFIQPQPAPQVQPAPQAIPGFAAQAAQPLGPVPEFGTEAYYQYQQQAQAAGYHLNQGAANEQEAYRQRQAYMDSLKAQYDQDNDCAKSIRVRNESNARLTLRIDAEIARRVLEDGVPLFLVKGEDEFRPLDERVESFATKVCKDVVVFDTKEYPLEGIEDRFRIICSPMLIATMLSERLEVYLQLNTGHWLEFRRYYRQIEY